MTNLKDFAMNILAQNPQIANNPNAQNMIQAIQSGDDKRWI